MAADQRGCAYIKQLREKPYEEYIEEAKALSDQKKRLRRQSNYYDCFLKYEVQDNMILYEAFGGRGITCNPAALFYYLLNDERFSGYTHVWSLEESEFKQAILEQYKDHPNVVFVKPFTKVYYKYLSQSKYLITNMTFPYFFIKKEEQVLINTWHGIPMKHIGYDTPDGTVEVGNTIRNILMTDYLLSPVPYMTDIYRTAFKLDGIFPGKVIEAGYPRVDETFHSDKKKVAEELEQYGVRYDAAKKLILYAPTYRGGKFEEPEVSLSEYNRFLEILSHYADPEEYQILFKPHQIVYNALREKGVLPDHFIPAVIDTNRLLGIVDILVSDYSSIFFDFLVTKRPILFYIPDLEQYMETRGLYFPADDLPGPISNDPEQIGKWISEIEQYPDFFDGSKYEAFAENYVSKEDGHVCERIIDAVFFGDETHCIPFHTKKKKLLFHLDSCKDQEIAASAVSLINHLDLSKYDVSVFAGGSKPELRSFFRQFKPEIHLLRRMGSSCGNVETKARIQYCLDQAVVETDPSKRFPLEAYQNEFRRCFGNAAFDVLIDFSGLDGYWACLYAAQKEPKKLIWMHHLMMHAYNREENGQFPYARELENIFKVYPRYDACVGSSKSVMEINEKELEEAGVCGNFRHVRDLFDEDYVRNRANEYTTISLGNEKNYLVNNPSDGETFSFLPLPEKGMTSFVSFGRVTPDGNQNELVKAFARIHKTHPETRLFLIGDGEAIPDVRRLIRQTGLSGKVLLIGEAENPFAILGQCSCFIHPAFSEEMPMLLFAAGILDLSLLVSSNPALNDAICSKEQLLTGTDEEALYEGMKAFLEGNVPTGLGIEIGEYNREGLREWDDLLADVIKTGEEKS